jgi:uncharacterized membrane protein HdeD (DUF308 family)
VNPFTSTTHSSQWSMFVGVLLLAAGALAIVLPFLAALTASIFFGWLLLLGATLHFAYAWSERGGAIAWQVLLGLVYLAAAVSLLLFPVAGVLTLTLVLGCYLTVEGLVEVVVFLRLHHLPGTIWFLVDGVVTLLLAGLILAHWPSSSVWALGTLVGISLFFSGMARLMHPVRRRHILLPAT